MMASNAQPEDAATAAHMKSKGKAKSSKTQGNKENLEQEQVGKEVVLKSGTGEESCAESKKHHKMPSSTKFDQDHKKSHLKGNFVAKTLEA